MAFQLFGQKFMYSRPGSIFCSNFIMLLQWRSWKSTQNPLRSLHQLTYSFIPNSATLCNRCSHSPPHTLHDGCSNVLAAQVFQTVRLLDSCNAVATHTHREAHKQSLLYLATFKFGLIPNSWPQNFKTKVVSLDLCMLQLRMKRAGHGSKAINFEAENIINDNV